MSQEIPDKIYLQIWHEDGELSHWPTWCVDRIHDTDILYTQTDPGRLRLLEAVVTALLIDEPYGYIGMPLVDYLAKYGDIMSDRRRAVLEALAALEALDEKEQP